MDPRLEMGAIPIAKRHLFVALLIFCGPKCLASTRTEAAPVIDLMSRPEAHDKTSGENAAPLDGGAQDSAVFYPVKRFIGSIAKQGGLPAYYKGKRIDGDDIADFGMEESKRFLGSVVNQGGVRPGKRPSETNSNNQLSEEVKDDGTKDDEIDEAEEKRYVGSVARYGGLRPVQRVDRRFDSDLDDGPWPINKRYLGSLARAGELGGRSFVREAGKRNIGSLARSRNFGFRNTGKRTIGSLARSGELRFRSKRSVAQDWFPADDDSDAYDDYDDDLTVVKKHIGSLARMGWLPYLRSQRRSNAQSNLLENPPSYIRSYPSRDSTSISSRLRLLNLLKQEQAASGIADKRTIASLARGGELPVRYRASRSTEGFYERPAPPITRMMGSRDLAALKAPHAFSSFHEWNRGKRNSNAQFAEVAGLGPRRCDPSNGDPQSQEITCVYGNEIGLNKRHLASIARAKELRNKQRFGQMLPSPDNGDSYEASSYEDSNWKEIDTNDFGFSKPMIF